jgi:hypothetical protein
MLADYQKLSETPRRIIRGQAVVERTVDPDCIQIAVRLGIKRCVLIWFWYSAAARNPSSSGLPVAA